MPEVECLRAIQQGRCHWLPLIKTNCNDGLIKVQETTKTKKMNNKILITISLVFVVLFSTTQLQAQLYKCSEGTVSFFSEAPVENIDAKSKSINSFINTDARTIAFVIPVSSFVFKKALMQEHFNEKYMESEKFPMLKFSGTINEPVDFTKEGVYKVTATGKLTIHGVENQVTEQGTITIKNSTIQLTTEFMVALKDYKIEIPKLLFQNIAETISVKLIGVYTPYKK